MYFINNKKKWIVPNRLKSQTPKFCTLLIFFLLHVRMIRMNRMTECSFERLTLRSYKIETKTNQINKSHITDYSYYR